MKSVSPWTNKLISPPINPIKNISNINLCLIFLTRTPLLWCLSAFWESIHDHWEPQILNPWLSISWYGLLYYSIKKIIFPLVESRLTLDYNGGVLSRCPFSLVPIQIPLFDCGSIGFIGSSECDSRFYIIWWTNLQFIC
jgi:hypothetical protein